ncbi:hypothetical protein PA598K_01418 [Paenibacillus sp. 598K]|uniref:hypothetical protein n=1 Tax=Paenibacillus sp. 598K TaxID=1117987 RepID=UPI000FFA4574|nr:hypothetical protein [Paenibacillus sp. 598K]GBF73133.1 hypothetical protein PA598K_01418 [Paenibacillus sp. 598K]
MEAAKHIKEVDSLENIKEKVTHYIEGKEGRRIGLIVPENLPTEEELDGLYRRLAEIALRSNKKNDGH